MQSMYPDSALRIFSHLLKMTLLSSCLALKGSTAINLTIFNLPRLSVDIDLDFIGNLPRDKMLSKRGKITDYIVKYMESSGYTPILNSKKYHALDSFVYEYQNSGGMKDNLKIEINYMLRCHVLPESLRQVNLPWAKSELTVLILAPIEIFASKIVALLSRTAPRDLYDIQCCNMAYLTRVNRPCFGNTRCYIYSAIGSETVPDSFHFDSIAKIPQYRIKIDLLPVLRRGEHFDLKSRRTKPYGICRNFLLQMKTSWRFGRLSARMSIVRSYCLIKLMF